MCETDISVSAAPSGLGVAGSLGVRDAGALVVVAESV